MSTSFRSVGRPDEWLRDDHATLLLDGMTPFEPAIASEFFDRDNCTDLGVEWCDHVYATERPGRVRLRRGPDVFVEHDLSACDDADTIVVPGWSAVADLPSPAVADTLRAAHARGARLVSFCTGAFALAAVGLLDGTMFTAAGSASCIDLGRYLVRLDHGAAIANEFARGLVVPPHRDGGQAQYVATPVATCPDEDPLRSTLDWAVAHLDLPLTLDDLADRAMMSSRNFSRRFVAATGRPPS